MMDLDPPEGYEIETQRVTERDDQGKPTIVVSTMRRSTPDTRDPHQALFQSVIDIANARDVREREGHMADAAHAQLRILRTEHQRQQKVRDQRSKGGKARAAKDHDVPGWMASIFDQAYDVLDRDGLRRIGWSRLVKIAWKIAGRDHPEREAITKHRALQYLERRRLK
jgi:hypothetical protein